MPTSFGRISCALFFFINLTPQAYCTEAHGLKIDLSSNIRKNKKSGESSHIKNLTEIKNLTHASTIEEVSYTLLQDDTSFDDTDTDEEEETSSSEDQRNTHVANSKMDKLPGSQKLRKFKYNRSRHMPQGDKAAYKPRRNHLKTELKPNQLRVQLSQDAFDIVASEPNSQTQKSTVCFCVALRDKDGYVKKFAFHNGANVMSPAMRTKAHESGYDVIQVEQSHAEGQFLQFLLHRHKKRPGLYTHIMGMGGSKCYCAECNHMLKRVLGSNYHKVAASVYDKKDESGGPKPGSISATSAPSGSDEADNSDDDVSFTQNIAKDIQYKVGKGEKIIDTASYDNCYLSDSLKQIFGEGYDLSNPRFTKSTAEVVKKRTRRRNSKETKPAG